MLGSCICERLGRMTDGMRDSAPVVDRGARQSGCDSARLTKQLGRLGLRIGVLLSLYFVTATASAQQCPSDVSCNPSFGSVILPSRSSRVPNRIMHGDQRSPDGLFFDQFIALTYNRSWDRFAGAGRDDITQPLVSLALESYWNGNMELNIDMAAANSNNFRRPYGFDAAYNGSATRLFVGGPPYAAGASGIFLEAGNAAVPSLLTLTDSVGASASHNMLQMSRQDGSASFAWRAGGIPRLNFALQPNYDAKSFSNFGVLKFHGKWDLGEPLFEFEAVGPGARLIQSIPAVSDVSPRFFLQADGAMDWGSGNGRGDTNLYRSNDNTLRTDGNFVVGGNLQVLGTKAALVQTASYGKRELYAVEAPGEWFEDFGAERLVDGLAVVKLDPVFGQTVSTERPYHVFITPSGRCNLYVSEKGPASFTIRALSGARDCAFDYRIIAKRKGYEGTRLARISDTRDHPR
jgi:hypothetical protein